MLTSRFESSVEPIPSSDPRENLVHNVVHRYFTFDVCEGPVAEGLNFKLDLMC